MRIARIAILGLFGRFNHSIEFDPDERVTIMIGPNGFGKTMLLRILDALFNRPVRTLERMPFQELSISFDNNPSLRVQREPGEKATRRGRYKLTLTLEDSIDGSVIERYEPKSEISEADVSFPISAVDDFMPMLHRIGPEEWINVQTDEVLDLNDVILEYGDHLPFGMRSTEAVADTPSWLEEIRDAIPVRFIGTERLTYPSFNRYRTVRHRRNDSGVSPRRSVRQYSEELSHKVQQTLSEYGTLSQSLDRTFPARLVEEPDSPVQTIGALGEKLQEVEAKRARIVEAGLLVQQEEGLRVPLIESIDESKRGVLAVYAEDALRKLGVFDDLYDRVNALKTIANARFNYKRVSVSVEGIEVSAADGSSLNLEMLSSGEQHELVLLYNLLFGTAKNSVIMIDEPELSLHVAWQDELLNDLVKMAELSDFRALLATHSPQIIGDRWDLTVELRGPGPNC